MLRELHRPCYYWWILKHNYGFSKQRTEKASEAEKTAHEKGMKVGNRGIFGNSEK